MWDLLYYLAGISAVGTVGFGVLYFYDRDTADEISREIGWNAVKAYHKINLEYDIILNELYLSLSNCDSLPLNIILFCAGFIYIIPTFCTCGIGSIITFPLLSIYSQHLAYNKGILN